MPVIPAICRSDHEKMNLILEILRLLKRLFAACGGEKIVINRQTFSDET
jgi:hypothetical protein